MSPQAAQDGPVRFRGLFPIVHTPFTAEGAVDYDSLQRLVSHVRERAEGMTFPGFASEFCRLTDDEILACARTIVKTAGPDCRVILNITAQATQRYVHVNDEELFAAVERARGGHKFRHSESSGQNERPTEAGLIH
jgi:hypothetical protein